MMAIAIAPTFFLKKPAPPPVRIRASSSRHDGAGSGPDPAAAGRFRQLAMSGDTVEVISPLYRYEFSTRGAHLVQATILGYPSLTPAEHRAPARLVPATDTWYTYSLVVGNDTLSLDDWYFTPSTETLRVNEPARLTFTAARGNVQVEITYGFRPDDYRVHVSGQVSGIGPNGATLVVGLGNGLAHTEADSAANQYEFGIVTKTDESQLKRFAALKPGETTVLSGPFEWVAVKSKYFVAAVLAIDSASSAGQRSYGCTAVRSGQADPGVGATGAADPGRGGFRVQRLRRAHGVRPAPGHRPRLLRHESLRVAGIPDHHPAGRGRRPLAPGLDAPAPAPGVRAWCWCSSAS